MNEQRLIELAVECGAAKAALVDVSDIVLSTDFRDICEQNACGMYGRCYMCPPDVGEIRPLMEKVRSYQRGLLYQTIAPLEDSFDIEGMQAAAEFHAQCTQRVRDALAPLLPPDSMHLAAGGCHLCEQCAKRDDLPCRFPERALPSMEACGINVYELTKATPLRYINGQNTVTYFSIALWRE